MKKRIVSLLLALTMCFCACSVATVPAFAATEESADVESLQQIESDLKMATGDVVWGALYKFFKSNTEFFQESRAQLAKADSEMLGTRFVVPRKGKTGVNVAIYTPANAKGKKLPVVFQVHGGAFVGGNADQLDTLSARMAKKWNAVIVTINYSKMDQVERYDTAREIIDTVQYFKKYASKYHIDKSKTVLLGYSAGGYYVGLSAIQMAKEGKDLGLLIMGYPFAGDLGDIYDSMTDKQKENFCPTVIITDTDPLKYNAWRLGFHLKYNGVEVSEKYYPEAEHGFIEQNNPEYAETNADDPARGPGQKAYARDAEAFMGECIDGYLG